MCPKPQKLKLQKNQASNHKGSKHESLHQVSELPNRDYESQSSINPIYVVDLRSLTLQKIAI